MVAAFGSGVAYSLVSAGLQGQPMNAITTAAGFSLFQGIFFKVSDHIHIHIGRDYTVLETHVFFFSRFCSAGGKVL